jgi:tRNA (guanine37-N1)-methyltransferase
LRGFLIFNVYTLFPEFFGSPLSTGLMGKAGESGIIGTRFIDIRDFGEDRYNRCDDYPYGGGSGMVLMAGPLFRALEKHHREGVTVIYTSPGGRVLDQKFVRELAEGKELSIICGHYEGVDQRVIDRYVDHEVSIGDYILSGGEFAALIIMNTIARHVPGFMSNSGSLVEESFETGLLEYPQYTRPETIEGMKVPETLLSGNHEKIKAWRETQSIEKTRRVRPDLYKEFILKKLTGEL